MVSCFQCRAVGIYVHGPDSNQPHTKKYVKEYFDNAEEMNSAVVEYIKAIPLIKVFNVTVKSFTRFYDSIQRQIEITFKWIKLSSPFYALFKLSLDFVLPLLMLLMSLAILDKMVVLTTDDSRRFSVARSCVMEGTFSHMVCARLI